jgi:hypothetical protein
MYCTDCGNKHEKAAKFCQNCGVKLNDSTSSEVKSPQQAISPVMGGFLMGSTGDFGDGFDFFGGGDCGGCL